MQCAKPFADPVVCRATVSFGIWGEWALCLVRIVSVAMGWGSEKREPEPLHGSRISCRGKCCSLRTPCERVCQASGQGGARSPLAQQMSTACSGQPASGRTTGLKAGTIKTGEDAVSGTNSPKSAVLDAASIVEMSTCAETRYMASPTHDEWSSVWWWPGHASPLSESHSGQCSMTVQNTPLW